MVSHVHSSFSERPPPNRTGYFHSIRLSSSIEMMQGTVSALRISRTSLRLHRSYLFPFAMWAASPPSDYYGNSVTMGLAPFR